MCVQLVKKGYEKYTLDHVFDVGFTKAYYEANKEICDKFIAVRMSKPLPSKLSGLRHQPPGSDTTSKLKDIIVPTLVMIGEDETITPPASLICNPPSWLAQEIPGAKFRHAARPGHHYPFVGAGDDQPIIRSSSPDRKRSPPGRDACQALEGAQLAANSA